MLQFAEQEIIKQGLMCHFLYLWLSWFLVSQEFIGIPVVLKAPAMRNEM